MALIETLYTAMTTRDQEDSGSKNKIVIIGNQNGVDKFQFTIAGTSTQKNREDGRANLYISKLVPSAFLDTQYLSRTYFRVGIRGDDLWAPQDFYIWGTAQGRQPVIPLAMGLDLHTQGVMRYPGQDPGAAQQPIGLSTHWQEGDISFPVHPVYLGNSSVAINRLLLVVRTAARADAGTRDEVKFQIQSPNGAMDFDVPDTHPQGHLERGQTNFFLFPTPSSFTKGSLGPNAIRLFIEGDDKWLPEALYLFGLDIPDGLPTYVVPLVHLEGEPVGWMSQALSEGQPSAVLPLTL